MTTNTGAAGKFESALGMTLGMTATKQLDATAPDLIYIDLGDVIKDLDMQGGQKDEHETTTLASQAKEYTGGLSDSGTLNLTGNFAPGAASHDAMMAAEADGDLRAFCATLKSGRRVRWLAFVKQYTWKAAAGGVLSATYQLKLSGRPIYDKAP